MCCEDERVSMSVIRIATPKTLSTWLLINVLLQLVFVVAAQTAEDLDPQPDVAPVEDVLLSRLAMSYEDFVPQAIIEVGAGDGVWMTQARRVYPDAKFLLVEACERHRQRLEKLTQNMGVNHAEFSISLVSNETGTTVEFYEGGNSGNSMFKENTVFYENDKPVQRVTRTLDDIVDLSLLLQNTPVDIIKADVQGAELLLLQGAVKTLSMATFVILEGTPVEYNLGGAACYYEVDEFLRSQGFYLYDFGEMLYRKKLFKTKGVGSFNYMYIKPSSPKLPDFLRRHHTRFCGQGRESKSSPQTERQQQSPPHSNQDANHTTKPVHSKAATWLSGFFHGVIVSILLPKFWGFCCRCKKSKHTGKET
jgi:FkbM family methyltransferase